MAEGSVAGSLAAPPPPSPSDDSPLVLAARLAANQASGNVTGNDWADARRRGRLVELQEYRKEEKDEDGEVTGGVSVVGYAKFLASPGRMT